MRIEQIGDATLYRDACHSADAATGGCGHQIRRMGNRWDGTHASFIPMMSGVSLSKTIARTGEGPVFGKFRWRTPSFIIDVKSNGAESAIVGSWRRPIV